MHAHRSGPESSAPADSIDSDRYGVSHALCPYLPRDCPGSAAWPALGLSPRGNRRGVLASGVFRMIGGCVMPWFDFEWREDMVPSPSQLEVGKTHDDRAMFRLRIEGRTKEVLGYLVITSDGAGLIFSISEVTANLE